MKKYLENLVVANLSSSSFSSSTYVGCTVCLMRIGFCACLVSDFTSLIAIPLIAIHLLNGLPAESWY